MRNENSIRLNFTLLSAMLLTLCGLANAQQIENTRYIAFQTEDGSKYKLTYDLTSPLNNVACKVRVKLLTEESTGNSYLTRVTGDVGDFIFPGTGKEIIWDHTNELIHYSGAVNLSIEVVPMIEVPSDIRKGKTLTINFDPAIAVNKDKPITLKGGNVSSTELTGEYYTNRISVQIPKKIKTLKNYQIALAAGDKVYYSNGFKIKRKFPLSVIIIPAVAIVTYLVYDKIQEDNAPLPGPPGSSGLPN